MAKYSFEFKLKIVQEYLEGNGETPYLSKKYGVKSKTQVKDWINAYREFGEIGLLRKRKNQYYSVQFKMDAIELYQTSELSYREVANHLGINNPALMANWMKIFRSEGIDGLSKTKGRPKILSKMENFFGLLKQEIYHGREYHSFEELKHAIDRYIHYYNYERMKEKLDWQSPVQFREAALRAA